MRETPARPTDPSRSSAQDRADRLRAYRSYLVIGTLLVIGWVLWSARGALFPFAIGLVFAYLLAPLVAAVQSLFPNRGWLGRARRTIAVTIVYLTGAAALVVAFMTIGPPIVNETYELIENLPRYWQNIRDESDYWTRQYQENIPADIRREIEKNLDEIEGMIASGVRTALATTFGTVRRFIGIVAGLLLLPLWLFYVLKDQRKAATFFYDLWPPALRHDVRNIVDIADRVLGAYVRGQVFLGFVVGSVTFVGLYVLDVNQAVALAVISGIFEMVPILGPWISFIAAAIVVLATEPEKIWAVAVLFFMIQQLENTFLVPKVQGTAVDMNPAIIILLLVVGGAAFGFIGILVIVPLAAIARNVFIYVYGRLSEEVARADAGAAPTDQES
jgi:predicted PurR-regulated permease PerM